MSTSGRFPAALASFAARRSSLIALGLVAALAVVLQVTLRPLTSDETIDSYSYYFAASALAQGLDPYDTATLQELAPDALGFVFPYLYPPVLAVLWRPLTALAPGDAHAVFVILNLVLAAVNGALVWSLVRAELLAADRSDAARLAGWLVLFVLAHAVMGPLVSSLRLGQVNVLLATLVLLALRFEQRDRPVRAGICLGAAILLKVTPVVFLVDLVLRRRWRTLSATFVGALAITGATLPWCGTDAWRGFARRTLDPLPFDPPMSLRGLIDALGDALGAENGVRLALYLLLVTVLVVRLARVLPRAARTNDVVGSWSALTLFGLLVAPLTWHHHYYLALLPMTVFTLRAFEPAPLRKRWVLAGLAVAMLLRYPGALHVIKPVAAFATLLL